MELLRTLLLGIDKLFPHIRRYKFTDTKEQNHGTLTYFIIRYRYSSEPTH
jgi:hypothetical protein